VVKADRANGMRWLPMSDLNNTYGFALTEQEAKQKGTRTISDIPTVPRSQMSPVRRGGLHRRLDGLIGVERAYGFSFPESQISELEYGLIYPTIGTATCSFGEVFTTDGRIATEDLYVLGRQGVLPAVQRGAGHARRDIPCPPA
jgi:osmoprotectant transport system substrate-binding protein